MTLTYKPYTEGSDQFTESFNDFTSRLVRADETGHSKFSPMPTEQFLNAYYNGGFSQGGNEVYNLETQFHTGVVDVARGVTGHMQAFGKFPEKFSFHDFGCAFGSLVYGFQQIGMTATGNEPNKAWVEAGNKYCNGALSWQPLDVALEALPYKVDLFTTLHVLEHLQDPMWALKAMKQHLSPEGLIYICVPNASSLQYMLGGRRKDPLYSFPMHLQYFTPKSMAAHLREAGLEPMYVSTRWLPDELNGEKYALETFLGNAMEDLVDPAAWRTAACENLLGSELFMLAGHPENTTASRMADLDERIEKAFRFSSIKRAKGAPKGKA